MEVYNQFEGWGEYYVPIWMHTLLDDKYNEYRFSETDLKLVEEIK